MSKSAGRVLAIIGLSLQAVVLVGVIIVFVCFARASTAIGNTKDVAEAAGIINRGAADSLKVIVFTAPIGVIGLILLGVAIGRGEARMRWVFWWSLAAMVPWLLIFPIGTLFGIVGLIFLLSKRRMFESVKKETAM